MMGNYHVRFGEQFHCELTLLFFMVIPGLVGGFLRRRHSVSVLCGGYFFLFFHMGLTFVDHLLTRKGSRLSTAVYSNEGKA